MYNNIAHSFHFNQRKIQLEEESVKVVLRQSEEEKNQRLIITWTKHIILIMTYIYIYVYMYI